MVGENHKQAYHNLDRMDQNEIKILQLAHGKIIPEYTSAYSMRCYGIFKDIKYRKIFSVAGTVFKDRRTDVAFQFRSIILTGLSMLKGNRSLEIFIAKSKFLRKKFIKYSKKEIAKSDVVVFEGPWHFRTFKDDIKGKVIIYDAHNVESKLREKNMFYDEVKKLEMDISAASDAIFCVTENNLNDFMQIYSVPRQKLFLVPHFQINVGKTWNGSRSDSVAFIGSVYSANIDAVNSIKRMAVKIPEIKFYILGNFPFPFRRDSPKNVIFTGIVNDNEKEDLICNSFAALNPVTEGSGRNLKMIDYIAHGIPIISTKVGCRGLSGYNIENIIDVYEPDGFVDAILNLQKDKKRMIEESKALIELYSNLKKKEGASNTEEITRNLLRKKLEIKL